MKDKKSREAELMMQHKRILADEMKQYVEIILKEFKDYVPEERKKELEGINDFNEKIEFSNDKTVVFRASRDHIFIPKYAYKIFKALKYLPGYGINKNHELFKDGEIINNNTFYDYIKHAIVSGMSVLDFFRYTLLHETMHFCGTGGGNPLSEAFTELKTRELAQKYGLMASRCGYPNEVGIAQRLQQLFGDDFINRICFTKSIEEMRDIFINEFDDEIWKSCFNIIKHMQVANSKEYNVMKYKGVLGPIRRAKDYSKIDYSKVNEAVDILEAKLRKQKNRQENSVVEKVNVDNLSPQKIDSKELKLSKDQRTLGE